MAEGIAKKLGHDAASAGTHPASEVSKMQLKFYNRKVLLLMICISN